MQTPLGSPVEPEVNRTKPTSLRGPAGSLSEGHSEPVRRRATHSTSAEPAPGAVPPRSRIREPVAEISFDTQRVRNPLWSAHHKRSSGQTPGEEGEAKTQVSFQSPR
jgi:hypothetical protein